MATGILTTMHAVGKAFDENRHEDFLVHCTEDVTWTVVGSPALQGKQAIRSFLADMPGTALEITQVSTVVEKDKGVGYGAGFMTRNGIRTEYGFCDIYRFEDGKIAEMTSYLVEHKS